MTLTPQNARISEALSSDRYHEEMAKVRLSTLWGQVMGTWARGNRSDFDRLQPLIERLKNRTEELTEEEDAALRIEFRVPRRTA